MKLDLRDFFEAFDRGDPYMLAAVSELYGELVDKAPSVLDSEANWYQTWKSGGKRDLKTGAKLHI